MTPNFDVQLKAAGIPMPQREVRFHDVRHWRFDYAWIAPQVAIEVEGGVWTGGRHNRGSGFIADMEKYNTAAILGWRVLRFTPKQMKDGTAVRFLVDAHIFHITPIQDKEIRTVSGEEWGKKEYSKGFKRRDMKS